MNQLYEYMHKVWVIRNTSKVSRKNKKQTLVLKDYYENSGYFFQINGEGKVDRITDDIFRVIDNYIE